MTPTPSDDDYRRLLEPPHRTAPLPAMERTAGSGRGPDPEATSAAARRPRPRRPARADGRRRRRPPAAAPPQRGRADRPRRGRRTGHPPPRRRQPERGAPAPHRRGLAPTGGTQRAAPRGTRPPRAHDAHAVGRARARQRRRPTSHPAPRRATAPADRSAAAARASPTALKPAPIPALPRLRRALRHSSARQYERSSSRTHRLCARSSCDARSHRDAHSCPLCGPPAPQTQL